MPGARSSGSERKKVSLNSDEAMAVFQQGKAFGKAMKELEEVYEAAIVPMADGREFRPKSPEAVRTAILLAADAGGTFLAIYKRKVGDLKKENARLKRELLDLERRLDDKRT